MVQNQITLIGNLGNDATLFNEKDDRVGASFSIATQRMSKKEIVTDWHNIKTYCTVKQAELLKKGFTIALEGSLGYETYEGEDGITKYKTIIFADNFKLLSTPKPTT